MKFFIVMIDKYTFYVSLCFRAVGYRVRHTSCDLTYRICSNINLLSRSLYVPLWVESILLMSSILIVITVSINDRKVTLIALS